jgi:LacI family transcriptional regulator
MKSEAEPRALKRPTQNDVARLAGVSRATVSYVLNGLADGKVPISPETRTRVEQAIAELGYAPNAGARALRSGSTQTIGLLLLDLRNPHFWENAEGVELEARAAGYRLLVSSMDLNAQYGEDALQDLAGRRVDALIMMGALIDQSAAAQEIVTNSLKRGVPIVELSDQPRWDRRVDCVISDYRLATTAAMDHLFALGHRRIGMVYGVPQTAMGLDRLESYDASLRTAGLEVDPALIIECGPTIEDGYQAARQLLALPQRPTAILAINDLLALGVLRAAADCNLRVPADFSLVGFDDIRVARYLTPRLTTASKDAVRLGRETVRLVLERLQDPDRPRQILHLPAQFVVRESTGPAPQLAAG